MEKDKKPINIPDDKTLQELKDKKKAIVKGGKVIHK